MKLGGICFNWKVVAGLAAVGVGIWAVAPNLLVAALPLLLVAACPLSMFFMMRGMGGSRPQQAVVIPQVDQQAALHGSLADESLPALQSRAARLQLQHEQIAREIARLEALESAAVREAEAVVRAANRPVRG